ncbi:2-hydroxychromene-2-carboxylate isomerase [Eleftheria terrae]|uniref:2-hydroxychromene-2-carboxylate isomerase n=1 Tax=Eleftheria terrae TaxID=1597781 RepID=UPI00263AE3F8|nr:2-hydroxychromene-2-carboxylate isomerase [Eleftheria terrae]WKB54829.1 2-hydroxychromene-2-carboxylate isomerase [Eleftheria terrae]
MKQLRFYFDLLSPYAWLAFHRLPVALLGCSYEVRYEPVLFAGLLQHHGQLGPAEIAPKRAWTYRQILWQARRQGVPLRQPATHPFNPLPLLRLARACAPAGGTPNRWVCETLFHHVWDSGLDAEDPARLPALLERLSPRRDPASQAVKDELRDATAEAARRGVFGVPTIELEGRLFWGADSLEMLRACLQGDPWFDSPEWMGAADWPAGSQRRQSRIGGDPGSAPAP